MAHCAATISHYHFNYRRNGLQLCSQQAIHLQNQPPANRLVHLHHHHWPVDFTTSRHMSTRPTVRDNQHTRLKYGKTSRHQHQSDVEFCVVPNRISRNKEKTPPIEVSFLGSHLRTSCELLVQTMMSVRLVK